MAESEVIKVAGFKYGFLTALIARAAIFVIFFFLDVTVFAALTTKKG